MRTVAFCEIEPFCRAVLRKHWPTVPIFEDVRSLHAADVSGVDLICGGFPCQDISLAGKGAGLAGERSGLWTEYARLIGEIKPRYAIIENVSALRSRGLDVVLGSLTALGYDAEWHCIPASAVGAHHRRDRVWIVAYSHADRGRQQERAQLDSGSPRDTADRNSRGQHADGFCDALADAARLQSGRQEQRAERERVGAGGESIAALADADNARLQGLSRRGGTGAEGQPGGHVAERGEELADTICERQPGSGESWNASNSASLIQREAIDAVYGCVGNQWLVEPDVGRVANGIPSRVDRLKSLGNAVVPQIPEIIGRAIMRAEGLAA